MSQVLELASELISRPSLTPDDAGCQDLVASRLQACGFSCEQIDFRETRNLWARLGTDEPLLVLLGHTDVVPPGPESDWQSEPFSPQVRNGVLYGRGAADMKSSVAAMVCALEAFAADPASNRGSVALLLTSDEEGAATDGVVRVVEALYDRGDQIDWCLVGEPTCDQALGDVVRVGRRGSLSGKAVVRGRQGHVAYPHLADNPIHRISPALNALTSAHWDDGDDLFPPTSFQVSNISAGTGAGNVIPGELTFEFNFRYGPASSADGLESAVTRILDENGAGLVELGWTHYGQPFVTRGGALVDAVVDSVRSVCGLDPQTNTGGGTSDGRFLAPRGVDVVEFGPLNATIHAVDECIPVADLDRLRDVYLQTIQRLLRSDNES